MRDPVAGMNDQLIGVQGKVVEIVLDSGFVDVQIAPDSGGETVKFTLHQDRIRGHVTNDGLVLKDDAGLRQARQPHEIRSEIARLRRALERTADADRLVTVRARIDALEWVLDQYTTDGP